MGTRTSIVVTAPTTTQARRAFLPTLTILYADVRLFSDALDGRAVQELR